MQTDIPATADLRVFIVVAQLASFTRAALQLHVPRSTVSTAIKRLEAQLGARLLQRTTRSVVLTDEGQALLGRGERLLEDLDELALLFRPDDGALRGRLRVDLPLGMSAGMIMTALPAFMRRHPGLQIDIGSSDRRVDVIADGFDCVVRVGTVGDESLACRRLGDMPLLNVASHRYVEEHGAAATVSDLARHWLVNYQPNPVNAPAGFEYRDGDATRFVPMPHRVTVNNSAAYGAACRAGFGIAQLPATSVDADLRSGSLIEVMQRHRPAAMPVNLLYPHRRNVPPRVRMFGDWLFELMRTARIPDAEAS